MKQGLLQVYTGNGKGKTTAALGLALRALGHDWRVAVVQFLKGGAKHGESRALKLFPTCHIWQYGRDVLIDMHNPEPQDIALARQGLAKARQLIEGKNYDLLILDEICVALALNLIAEEEVRELLARRPAALEIVLTGRYAPSWLIELADLVTEMCQIKHPFEQGIAAREGIEY
ncbi:MAG TPA: cob(I)yrinic acid a,c-diamide adenosyltransferase [Firmicutes bacterium]|nr:cob(I)yrinic acid a,c-diamide adenosyltransferase [Bacillota bacterium]